MSRALLRTGKTRRDLVGIAAIILTSGFAVTAQQMTTRPVTKEDLAAGLKNPTRWLTFSGDYTGQRHSPLKHITPQNVAGLVPQWVFQTDVPGLPGSGIETSPIVMDGVMYVTGNANTAWALDARTARPIWSYRRNLPPKDSAHVPVQADLTMGGVPRKVIMVANRNGFFYVLDRETGTLLVGKPFIDNTNWAKEIGADDRPIVLDNIGSAENCLPETGGIMTTASGLVFTGDNEGYFYAFDATSGKELWRFQVGAPVLGRSAHQFPVG